MKQSQCGVTRRWMVLAGFTIAVLIFISLIYRSQTYSAIPQRKHVPQSTSFQHDSGEATLSTEKKASKGFIFALGFGDQMTGSCMNLVSLQCWAHELSLSVLEPFVVRTRFGISIKTGQEGVKANAVRLSDVFDIDFWQKYTERMKYSHLVSWEDFLSSAPRKLIIAAQLTTGECESEMDPYKETVLPFANQYKFTIVREACFNFRKTGSVEKSKFKEDLYGEHSPNEVTVLFDRWGGIGNGEPKWRISLLNPTCQRDYAYIRNAPRKSASVSNDVQRYIDTYLNGSNTYIAVMIRFEYYFINYKLPSKSDEEQISLVDKCMQSIVSEWRTMSTKHSLRNTVLTMDFGKLGSLTVANRSNTTWMEGKVRGLFNDIYGPSLSLEQWEESFESVASKKAAGYIAVLQRELAARAQCLMVAGSRAESSFHGEAKRLYTEYHSGSEECVSSDACW